MSPSVLQMAQVITPPPPVHTLRNRIIRNKQQIVTMPLLPFYKLPRSRVVIKASSANSFVDAVDSVASLERCFAASADIVMKGGRFGALSTLTLEKPKLDTTRKQQSKSDSPELSNSGNNDDNNNNINNRPPGGGSDGNGDDDDYSRRDFDDGEDGDEGGLFRRRILLDELFARKFLDAVLNEWQKTMKDLPAGLRQAYMMGQASSAEMVRFLAINARPTTERFISRLLTEGAYRAFIGRMIADPAFPYKLLLEQAVTIGCSVWWEVKNRKPRLKQEWDLALLNVLTASACNAIIVWSLAPCRSYGNTFQYDLQNSLQKLPNNIFEKSYPYREFGMEKRIQSLFYKAAKLFTVGLTAGAVQGALSNLLAGRKEGRLSVTIRSVSTNALVYGSFLGLNANLRYQMLCGIDRWLNNRFDVIGVSLVFSTFLRIMTVHLGKVDPLVDSTMSSNWLISKNAAVKVLGLLGIKKQEDDEEARTPKPRRKRVVRKVTTLLA